MNTPLTERIWNAIPPTQLAFVRLLELLEVVASHEVPTAAMTLGRRSRLLVNPEFAAEHCRTDARLAMLVMHELFHVLLGHTRLFERITPAQNLAFDAVINAHLCNLFPTQDRTALFRALYRDDRFPEALLRPPEGWRTNGERWWMKGPTLRVHKALYSETSVTYTELFRLLEPLVVDAAGDSLDTGRLLGNHAEGEATSPDPDFTAAVREIIARWPLHERLSGRDEGGILEDGNIAPRDPRSECVVALRRALLSVVDIGLGGTGPVRPNVAPVETVLGYRTVVDRRAAVREAVGLPVLLHRAAVDAWTRAPAERAHVYLDVSGSMAEMMPLIYGAMKPLLGYIDERVHVFSTEVHDVTLRELAAGRVLGTGGTDIRCVTEHLLAQRVQRALIVTDGMVGVVPADDQRRLQARRVRLSAVVTEPGYVDFAQALDARVFRCPELSYSAA